MESELKLNNLRPEVDDEFSHFMQRVEHVESILKQLNSKEPSEREEGLDKAHKAVYGNEIKEINENRIRTKNDRTVINQNAFKTMEVGNEGQDEMSKDQFMRHVEKDAKERARDRKERKEASSKYMNEGNQAFRKQEYEKALLCFDKALELVRDNPVLYCNRALTYIKLEIHSKALDDANWALKLDGKSLKGHAYKAQALFKMGKTNESQDAIDEACKQLKLRENFFRELYAKWVEESQ